MLAAAANKKLRQKLFYEDEITSVFFGELKHLPVEIVWSFVKNLSSYSDIKCAVLDDKSDKYILPTKVKFCFWPKFYRAYSGLKCKSEEGRQDPTYAEPDLVVEFHKEGEPLLFVLFEIKWNSPLSPNCELVRQWAFRSEEPKNTEWIHIYLTKMLSISDIGNSLKIADAIHCDASACSEDPTCSAECKKLGIFLPESLSRKIGNWKKYLGTTTWSNAILALKKAVEDPQTSDLSETINGMTAFFKHQGISLFSGFSITKDIPEFQYTLLNFYPVTKFSGFKEIIESYTHRSNNEIRLYTN